MDYATQDIREFINRADVIPDMSILDIGIGGYISALMRERGHDGLIIASSPRNSLLRLASLMYGSDAVITSDLCFQPIKDQSMSAVLSYHSLELCPPKQLGLICKEVGRVLKKDGRFVLMIRSPSPDNDVQRSDLMLMEALQQMNLRFLHDFTDVSKALKTAGFDGITMEVVNRSVKVPEEWSGAHLKFLHKVSADNPVLLKSIGNYEANISKNGEELLPAVHFVAHKP